MHGADKGNGEVHKSLPRACRRVTRARAVSRAHAPLDGGEALGVKRQQLIPMVPG
jgi:hypothetical protein